MSNQIVNAAPMVIDYGTQDLSTRLVPREPEFIPQHLPKFYLFAEKGPTTPQLVVGNERDLTFGTESFNLRGPYANHSTIFSNLVNAEGNSCMIQRLIPDDAGPEANLIAWLDILPTTVDLYERNVDGSIKLDPAGAYNVVGTAPGYKVKWVVTHRPDVATMLDFGTAVSIVGDQVDIGTGVQSTRYPIFELKASSQGAFGNLAGIRLWAPTTDSVASMPTKLMDQSKVYPYSISVIRKADLATAAAPVSTIFAEKKITAVFKRDVIDPISDANLYAGDVLLDSYRNISDPRYARVDGDFGEFVIYDTNIELITEMLHAAEIPFIDAYSDFTADPADKHLFNFVTGVNSSNNKYQSTVFVDEANTVRMSEYTNVLAAGGSDGTMNDTVHADLVTRDVVRYLDPLDELQELAVNVESIIYDTGFPLATKYALASFVGLRKDTFVVMSTYEVGGPIMSASEEHSMAIALRTRLQNYPESDYFGTPVMRGMIVGRSGKLRNSQYTKHLPLSAEIAIKSARYMGAGNGRWTNGSHFDGAPGSVIDYMYDISIAWVPTSVRNRNWDVGLNWVQAYDRRSFFFPALKTVYANDTSVLNSYFTALAIGQLNKVAHATWREFTGVSNLSNPQLVSRVNAFVIARTINRFDARFVIEPNAFFTDLDLLRGFSWTLPIKIYAANMKTVMTSYVQAYRIGNLAQ